MQEHHPVRYGFLARMSNAAFYGIIFLYTLLLTFQGLDLSDEGLNAVFYQNIYTHPESVQYSFVFWFNGIIGGLFDQLFPSLGLWGLRFLGCISILLSVFLTHRLLEKYLRKDLLRIGILFAMLVIANNIRIFHYNYQCVVLFLLAATFLHKGLCDDKKSWLFAAGACVALETLTRIPSLVNVGLVLAIFFYGYLNNSSTRKQLVGAFAFMAGFGVCLAAMLALMYYLGHLTIFLDAMKQVKEMGAGDENSHYGLSKLIKQFFVLYGSAMKYGIFFAIPLLGGAIIVNFFPQSYVYRRAIVITCTLLLFAGYTIAVILHIFDHTRIMFVLVDLALVGCGLVILTSTNRIMQVLAFMGAYFVLTYPLGSSDGIYTVGMYTLWIALPIAFDFFGKLKHFQNHSKLESAAKDLNLRTFITQRQFRFIGNWSAAIILFALLFQAYYYPFFDHHPRTKMTHAVNNKYVKAIYTTQGRAQAVNEVLAEGSKYIQPGDAVLMYHTIPLLHYMTETQPYLANSMPWLYTGSVFEKELNETLQKTGRLPVIVRQLIKTVHDAANWPDPPAKFDESWSEINKDRDEALDAFIQTHNYTEVWRNGVFAILVPR